MFRTASLGGAFPPPPPALAPSTSLSSAANPIDLTLDDDDADEALGAAATRGPPWGPAAPNHRAPGANWASPAPLLSPLGSRQHAAQQQQQQRPGEQSMSDSPGLPLPSVRQLLANAPSSPPVPAYAHLPPPPAPALPAMMLSSPIGLPLPPPPQAQHIVRAPSWQGHAPAPLLAPPAKPAVIDLTSSPSPPPQAAPPAPACTLPADLPLKTPVCIGQLSATALVLLFNCPQLRPSAEPQGPQPEAEWTAARYEYQHDPAKPANMRETINLKTPSYKAPDGTVVAGESFGFVEQKVATALGPMLGKGLIRIDVKARKLANAPILPLVMLVYTPKGNIPVVGNYLREQGLLLDHPTPPFDTQRLAQCYYHNPHNPPPGGHGRALIGNGYHGPGAGPSRWTGPTVAGKSVEVQRSQAEELFKSLKTGDELEETEPAAEVATKLYPHQKKALTFLLERERERNAQSPDGHGTSLWQRRVNPFTGQPSWVHLVTQKEVFQEPDEAKGAILADDMGLGKTITCVSLIAATLDSARAFGESPLPPLPPPPPPRAGESALTAGHFAGSVWGMPDTSATGDGGRTAGSKKAEAKAAREADRQEAEYTRALRVKAKSRATLIVCPLSTISNWEDQIREHWAGEVAVVGGAAAAPAPEKPKTGPLDKHLVGLQAMGPLTQSLLATEGGAGEAVKAEARDAESTPAPSPPQLQPPAPVQRERTGRPCRVYVYHGNARRPDPAFLADFDVVITTFSTLATEYSKQSKWAGVCDDEEQPSPGVGEGMLEIDEQGNAVARAAKKGVKRKKCMPSASEAASALQSVLWFRVVLDEAHSIKETGTVACRACCDLYADRRLCLTGTPVQNKLDDVFALIKFLRLEPFAEKTAWAEYIGTPCKFGQRIGVARLQTIMKCITLRRTKDSRTKDGTQILSLPPRRDELRFLKFDPEEQVIYDQFYNESKTEFSELSRRNEVMKNYVCILQKILRLRQICDHYQLVDGKSLLLDDQGNCRATYEEVTAAIAKEGLTPDRAAAVFSLFREASSAQCVECAYEFTTPADGAQAEVAMDVDGPPAPAKRGRKSKAACASTSRPSSPGPIRPILTRCLHLFCPVCYRAHVCAGWPQVPAEQHSSCSVCQSALAAADAVELNPEGPLGVEEGKAPGAKKKAKRPERRQRGLPIENYRPSTKVRALIDDLMPLSRANPHSANYDPESIELQMVDDQGNNLDNCVKTVVFSQWTTMLDKVEDALESCNIRYERLDGTMKRDDRIKAMDALKYDPGCEVLLVSLRAGGVGLNLTAASRVYLMDPYWNPAVENQAVDRIHRLGQTRPVTTVKLVIENTIEDKLLGVQKRKMELADLTLGQSLSKAQNMERRMEELRQLFA